MAGRKAMFVCCANARMRDGKEGAVIRRDARGEMAASREAFVAVMAREPAAESLTTLLERDGAVGDKSESGCDWPATGRTRTGRREEEDELIQGGETGKPF